MLIRHVEIRPDDLLERIRTILGTYLTATHSASHDIGWRDQRAGGEQGLHAPAVLCSTGRPRQGRCRIR